MEQFFCRAANAELNDRDLRCESCPLWGQNAEKGKGNCCQYIENDKEFPEFIGCTQYDESYRVLANALEFAAMAHKGSFRKGSRVPYILHPMEAAMTTLALSDDIELAAAAALHDVIEDTAYTYEDISEIFGKKIADIVLEESENKRRDMAPENSWMIRKAEGIARIAGASDEAKIVALADKLSNMRATYRDYELLKDALFERFHRKEKRAHAWYHQGLLDALQSLAHTYAYKEYQDLYRDVFGRCVRVLVDADACPVVRIVEKIAEQYFVPVVLFCDTNHSLYSSYSRVHVVGAGADAVDFALVAECRRDDIVVTQDYGVAALVLAKGAKTIHQSGKEFTDENIDTLLMTRHLTKEARAAKSKHHIKGPSKRTKEDDERFASAFRRMLERKIEDCQESV